ncbi:MAG TPA: hypothetical protein VGO47_05640 [Chlamydiales bacterium]|nr:hypothetical protein [Chlamydiales bacterium]
MQVRTQCEALGQLFETLPALLPESAPNTTLPPHPDLDFAAEEGAWAAYNKAMHAAFGDKAKGLQICERGMALKQTIEVTNWCLDELETNYQTQDIALVSLWLDALEIAAKAAGAAGRHFHLFHILNLHLFI